MVTELLATQNSGPITFPGVVPLSIWVEWDTPGIGTAEATLDFRLLDDVSGNTVFTDRLVFHPFTAVVIVLGGRNQVPADPPNDDDGIFFVARDLYREGYDVHMYDEDHVIPNTTANTGAAYLEVENAVSNRGVTSVAIFGYSWGGGATYNLTAQVNALHAGFGFTMAFTAYVDAIVQDNVLGSAEDRRPPGTAWHLNIYQQNDPLLTGAPMPEDHPDPNHRADEDIDTDVDAGFTRGLDHSSADNSIDNDLTVQTHLKNRFREHVVK